MLNTQIFFTNVTLHKYNKILQVNLRMDECIFCKIIKGDVKSWKIYEDDLTYAFLDIHPASKYHTLVIPKKHFVNMFDVPVEDLIGVAKTLKRIVGLFEEKLGIKNLQIINSSGKEAQQDVFHLHYHIVPREIGDGQDVKWTTHSKWIDEFDRLLDTLK
jgi:histidine triad (HIT) family protein